MAGKQRRLVLVTGSDVSPERDVSCARWTREENGDLRVVLNAHLAAAGPDGAIAYADVARDVRALRKPCGGPRAVAARSARAIDRRARALVKERARRCVRDRHLRPSA